MECLIRNLPPAGVVLALLLLGCGGAGPREGAAPGRDEVVVAGEPGSPGTTYTVRSGDCAISWQIDASDSNRGVIRHQPKCGLTPGEQAPLIARLLHKLLEAGAGSGQLRTLSWGRLYPDGARDATMAVRLALAAKRSPEWDVRKGAPRGGDINGFVRKLAEDQSIYRELRRVFEAEGLDLRLAAVEKVLVLKARDLPFLNLLREEGVAGGDALPFDCQAWFSVARPTDGTQKGKQQ